MKTRLMYSPRFAFFIAGASCLVASGCRPPKQPLEKQPFVGRYLTNNDYVRYWIDVRADRTFSFWGSSRRMGDRGFQGTWRPSSDGCITLDSLPRQVRCSSDIDDSGPDVICCIDPSACPEPGPFELCDIDDATRKSNTGPNDRVIYKRTSGSPAKLERIDTVTRYDAAADNRLDEPCYRKSNAIHCYCAFERDLASLDKNALTGHLHIDAAEPSKLGHLRGSHLEALTIYDPSLTSLDDLPPITTLKTLVVQAPLRRLPDLSGFTSLETVVLDKTHLRDFGPLAAGNIKALDISTYQPVDLGAFAPPAHLELLRIKSPHALHSEKLDELLRDRPELKIASWPRSSSDRWPNLCGVLSPPTMQPCGWMEECFANGLCSTNAQGQCFAANDEDCQQSDECTAKGKCSAQNGMCVDGNPSKPTGGH
ncbi:MAG TPA: hypothetical protein PK156_26080 [Polyangium sp.]|nr:hypothetical protein [Polyangium sp.]